jgi:hypothetical protein
MSKENQEAFHNFISGYIKVTAALERESIKEQQPAVNLPPLGERRIADRRLGERRVGERRVVNLNNWQVIAEKGGS